MVGCIWWHIILLGLETHRAFPRTQIRNVHNFGIDIYIFSVRLGTVLPSRNALKMGDKSTLFSVYAITFSLPIHEYAPTSVFTNALIPIGQFKWKSLLQFFGYLDRIPFSICMQNLWNKNRFKTWLNISQKIHAGKTENTFPLYLNCRCVIFGCEKQYTPFLLKGMVPHAQCIITCSQNSFLTTQKSIIILSVWIKTIRMDAKCHKIQSKSQIFLFSIIFLCVF